jgi:hypothetical protein
MECSNAQKPTRTKQRCCGRNTWRTGRRDTWRSTTCAKRPLAIKGCSSLWIQERTSRWLRVARTLKRLKAAGVCYEVDKSTEPHSLTSFEGWKMVIVEDALFDITEQTERGPLSLKKVCCVYKRNQPHSLGYILLCRVWMKKLGYYEGGLLARACQGHTQLDRTVGGSKPRKRSCWIPWKSPSF